MKGGKKFRGCDADFLCELEEGEKVPFIIKLAVLGEQRLRGETCKNSV